MRYIPNSYPPQYGGYQQYQQYIPNPYPQPIGYGYNQQQPINNYTSYEDMAQNYQGFPQQRVITVNGKQVNPFNNGQPNIPSYQYIDMGPSYQQVQPYGYPQQQIMQQPVYGYPQQPYPYYYSFDPIENRRIQEQLEIQRRTYYEEQIKIWNTMRQSYCDFYHLDYNPSDYEDVYEVPQPIKFKIKITRGDGTVIKNTTRAQEELPKTETGYERMKRQAREQEYHNKMVALLEQKRKQIEYDNYLKEQRLAEVQAYNSSDAPNESLYDFFKGSANQRYLRIRDEECRSRERKNVALLYNSKDFNNVLALHNKNPQYMNFNFNLDDIEVTLPDHLKSSYQERREKFIESIVNYNPKLINM